MSYTYILPDTPKHLISCRSPWGKHRVKIHAKVYAGEHLQALCLPPDIYPGHNEWGLDSPHDTPTCEWIIGFSESGDQESPVGLPASGK